MNNKHIDKTITCKRWAKPVAGNPPPADRIMTLTGEFLICLRTDIMYKLNMISMFVLKSNKVYSAYPKGN